MAVLTGNQIVDRILREPDWERRLTVSPVLNLKEQVSGNSLDVRLGSHFITHKRTNVPSIDPNEFKIEDITKIEEERFTPIGNSFVLHPRQFTLGGTLEYIGMPNDLVAYVVGKSSWGRLGLVIATATGVHSCFRGIITLEIANLGEVPLRLYPGRPIAQLFFHESEPQSFDKADVGAGFASVKPEGSRLTPYSPIDAMRERLGYSI